MVVFLLVVAVVGFLLVVFVMLSLVVGAVVHSAGLLHLFFARHQDWPDG